MWLTTPVKSLVVQKPSNSYPDAGATKVWGLHKNRKAMCCCAAFRNSTWNDCQPRHLFLRITHTCLCRRSPPVSWFHRWSVSAHKCEFETDHMPQFRLHGQFFCKVVVRLFAFRLCAPRTQDLQGLSRHAVAKSHPATLR